MNFFLEKLNRSPILFFAFLFLALMYCLPWYPDVLTMNIDPSWRLAYHYFFDKSFDFGNRVIFSHGPYGFVNTWGYYPSTYFLSFFIHFIVTALYVTASWQLLKNDLKNKWAILGLSLALALSWNVIDDSSFPRDAFFYSGGVLCFLTYWRNWDKPYQWLHWSLLAFLAFSSLIKTTFFVTALVTLLFVTIDEVYFKKRPPVSLLFFTVAIGSFWILAGQPLVNFLPFLQHSFAFSKGYGDVQGGEPNLFTLIELVYIGSAFLIMGGVWFYLIRKQTSRAWFAGVGLLGLFFLIYRAAFTRQDHGSLGIIMLAIFSVYLTPFFISSLKKQPRIGLWVLIGFIVWPLIFSYAGSGVFSAKPLAVFSRVAKPFVLILNSKSALQRRLLHQQNPDAYNTVSQLVKAHADLSDFHGTMDIYPYDSALIISSGKEYSPRPAFQSYAVTSESMAKLNAEHLKSEQSPEYVLARSNTTLNGKAIMDFYPSSFDSLYSLELFARYRIYGRNNFYSVLKKLDVPREYSLQGPLTVDFRLGETIETPRSTQGLLWAKMEFHTTWIQKLFALLGKSLALKITALDVHGKEHVYRLSPQLSKIGFLVSPLLKDDFAAALFYSHQNQQLLEYSHIRQIRIDAPSYGWWKFLIKPQAKVLFYNLEINDEGENSQG